jgi:glycosyltransferase involved in cell wall biosynthesis
MRPYLSLIIPSYNNPEAVGRLLASIALSKRAPSFEIIIVDDGSAKRYKKALARINWTDKTHPIRKVTLQKNQGPAVARNRGVARATGEFVVFLDADVEVFSDTLYQVAKVFRDDPDVVALTGVWVKEQKTHAFFPNFKALRDWSYWINERDHSGYYYLFSTRIAAIKRSVFLRLGGFDETYPAPLVEDIELTYRIARRYAILFAPQARVRHEFEGFYPVAKKYFLRAYFWTKLYARRKKFDPVATTLQEAATTLSGAGTVALTLALGALWALQVPFVAMILWLWAVVLFVHLLLVRKFLVFVYKEKGIVFAVKSFIVGLVLYCFIFAGALWGRVNLTPDKSLLR